MTDAVTRKADGDKLDAGDTLRFEEEITETSPFGEDGSLADPDTIEISVQDSDGNTFVDSESMTRQGKGKYYFNWDTSGLDEGYYEKTVKVVKANIEETDTVYLRLQ